MKTVKRKRRKTLHEALRVLAVYLLSVLFAFFFLLLEFSSREGIHEMAARAA
jgi:hypothetical protein